MSKTTLLAKSDLLRVNVAFWSSERAISLSNSICTQMLIDSLPRHDLTVAAGVWSSTGCRQRLNWQVTHGNSHPCLITNRLLMCELNLNPEIEQGKTGRKLQASPRHDFLFWRPERCWNSANLLNLPLHTYTHQILQFSKQRKVRRHSVHITVLKCLTELIKIGKNMETLTYISEISWMTRLW